MSLSLAAQPLNRETTTPLEVFRTTLQRHPQQAMLRHSAASRTAARFIFRMEFQAITGLYSNLK